MTSPATNPSPKMLKMSHDMLPDASDNLAVPSADCNKSKSGTCDSLTRSTVSRLSTGSWASSSPKAAKRRKRRMATMMIDYGQMSSLRKAFLDRWGGEDLGLTRKEFQTVAKETINMDLTEEEVDRLFQQMDLRGTGVIRWRDYITSIGQTAQLRAVMDASAIKPLFRDKMEFINTKHRDEIVRIRFLPRLSLQSTKINYKSGRYLMLGRQGHVTVWSINLIFISSHYIGASEGLRPFYFVDMVILYPSTLIAVTSTDRKITLYELGSRGIQEKYSIVTLGNCVTCMDFWSDLCSRTNSLLVWGDTAGDIHALEMNINRLGGIFDKDQNREIISRVVYADLAKHKFPTVHLYRAAGVHDDWVTAVRYIPENRAFLSSSRSSTRGQSMLYSDWDGKAETRHFHTSKAVLCFDFNHIINIVVTGSLDCCVRVWNFFMGQRPIITLSIHTAPIVHVCLSPGTQHVISLDKTRAIKISNLWEGTVIQSFSGPSLQCMGGRGELTGFYFNTVRCQLIVATNMLATTTKRTNPSYMAEISAHDFPISAVCYSRTFNEILTACANAVISVWDIYTGRHVLRFQHFSPKSQFQELPWAKDTLRLEVTAMVLDPEESSVLTGSNDGTINVWNFSTGVLISYHALPDNTLVTGLVVDRNSIFVTGWFKRVYQLDRNHSSNAPPKCFNQYHNEEVNCMAMVKGGLLATGAYDGDVLVAAKDTGRPVCILNAGGSHLPIPMKNKNVEEGDKKGADNASVEEEEEYVALDMDSQDDLIPTEEHSILRSIRLTDELVVVSNPLTKDAMRIIRKPKKAKSLDDADPGMVFDALKGSHVTDEESAATFRAYESSIETLLSLNTRKHLDIHTASILTAGAEGWIRAWSLNPQGGLKGQFLATEYLGEAVKVMATDIENEFLITGDTMGYIKVWDLFTYCNYAARQLSDAERQQRRDYFSSIFIFLRSPFLRDRAGEGFRQCRDYHKRPPPPESKPSTTLKTPLLLNVFRAHMQAITCMQYVDEHKLILSGGKDCSVRVWTIRGSFVGQCGSPWVKLPEVAAMKQALRLLPVDIRRNASARTFRVIRSGCVPLWDRAVHLAKNYLEEKQRDERKKAKKGELKGEQQEEEVDLETKESLMTQPIDLGAEEEELPEELRLSNVIKFDWKDPKRSCVLGKAFKPNLHHRHSPVPPVTVEENGFGMFPAYHQMRVVDLTTVTHVPTPQMVRDMEAHRREEEEEAQRWRNMRKGNKRKQSKPPPKGLHAASRREERENSDSVLSEMDLTANCASTRPSTCSPDIAVNNSAIDASVDCAEAPHDTGEDTDEDLADPYHPCVLVDSSHSVGVIPHHPFDPSQERLPTGKDKNHTLPSMVKVTSTRKATAFSGRKSRLKKGGREATRGEKSDELDILDDVSDTADVDTDTQGGYGVQERKDCMFPPLTDTKQLTVTTKPGSNNSCTPAKDQSKTLKLPAVWTKQIKSGRFNGTGLWFNK